MWPIAPQTSSTPAARPILPALNAAVQNVSQLAAAEIGHEHGAAFVRPSDPAQFEQAGSEGSADPAREVVALLAPIHAIAQGVGAGELDAEIRQRGAA
jgi:hypothetical protein